MNTPLPAQQSCADTGYHLSSGVADIWQGWHKHMEGQQKLAARTTAAYIDDVGHWLNFLASHKGQMVDETMLGQLTAQDLRAFLAFRRTNAAHNHTRAGAGGLNARSLSRNLSAVRAFHNFLARFHAIEAAGLFLVKAPKKPISLPRPVSMEGARSILEMTQSGAFSDEAWIAARDHALISLLYGAGLRISEALSLSLGQAKGLMAGASGLIITGKGGKQRNVPILPAINAAITAYIGLLPFALDSAAPVFRGARGGPLGPRNAQALMGQARTALGLGPSATPHAMRHAFASHILHNGADLMAIKELLGHASLSTTQRYTEVDARHMMANFLSAHPHASKR